MPVIPTIEPELENEIKRSIYFGEKARQKEENYGKIDIAYKDKNVTEFVITWLQNNKIRTPSIIQDFFDQLNDYVDIVEKEDTSKREKRLRKKLSNEEKYRDYIMDRRKVFEEIISEQDKRMDIDSLPPELDAVIASELNYARSMIVKEAKRVNQILKSFQIQSRKYTTQRRYEIFQKMRAIIFSIIIIDFRLLEILIYSKMSSDLHESFELLEWDINTLQLTRFGLDEYIGRLLKTTWDSKWTDEFTDETKELIRLFRD